MTPEHLFVTQCKECDKKFTAPSLAIPIVGKTTEQRAAEYVGNHLMRHAMMKHPDMMGDIGKASQTLFGFLATVRCFDIEDPELIKQLDQARRGLHLATRGRWIDDATIIDRVARLGLDEDKQNEVVQMLVEMRDLLCEVQAPAASVLVTPNGHAG